MYRRGSAWLRIAGLVIGGTLAVGLPAVVAIAGAGDIGTIADSATRGGDETAASTRGGWASLPFSNRAVGQITVVKQTDPDGAAQLFQFTATWGTFSLSDGGSNSWQLRPGKYSINEAIPEGWILRSATCSDGSPISVIKLGPRENVTCTFLNVQTPLPPISPPISPPVTPPICPPISPPVSGPLPPPIGPPVTPPVTPPISPPVTGAVTAFTAQSATTVCVTRPIGLEAFLASAQARLVGGVSAAIVAFSMFAGLGSPVADRVRRRARGS